MVRTTGDGTEPFLPSCVPYLQFDGLVVQEYLFDLKVNAVCTGGQV